MAKITVFVKIFAAGTGNNSTVGLVSGNLQWCSAPGFSGWLDGMFGPDDIAIAPQSFNPANGGGLGGFDGETELNITDSALALLVSSGDIQLTNRQIAVWVGVDTTTQADAYLKFNGTITGYDSPKKTVTRIVSDSSISLDLKKIPSIVVTREMALNVKDSSAIGKTISPVYGNNVIYPMVYCDASESTIATMVSTDVRSVPDSTLLFNGVAPDVITDSPWSQQMLPDGSFMIGKSMLEVVAAWQSSTTSNVWIALSFNGKTLLADPAVSGYIANLKKSLVGRRFRCVHGTGKGSSYLITDLEYIGHEVQVDNTDVNTLWFQLDTTTLSDFRYSLPAYTTTRVGGNSNAPLYFRDMGISNCASNLFVGANRDGKPDSDISYLSFQADAGAFIVPASANTGIGAKVLAKTETGYMVALVPSQIRTLYESDKWKLVQFDMDSDFGSDEAQFLQVETVDMTSYLLENRTGSFTKIMNAIGITPAAGGSFVLTDKIGGSPIISELTDIDTAGLTLVAAAGDQFTITARSQNTLYIPSDASVFIDDFDLRILPDIKISFLQQPYQTAAYYIVFEFDLFAIAESNIAITKTSFSAKVEFDGWPDGTTPAADYFHVDPATKSFKFSENCFSHDQISESLYGAMEKALFMGASQLSENKRLIRGFILSIGARYEWVAFNGGLDFRNAEKIIKPATAYLSKTADKKELYLSTVSSATVTAPVRIAQLVAESNGITCDTASFDAVEVLQRAYFSNDSDLFDGQYNPEPSESISDVIDDIGKQTMTAFFLDASGVLNAKFLPSLPSAVSIEFTGEHVVKGSMSVSMPKNGYLYSDFDFEAKSHPLLGSSVISVDTDGADTFPSETDYPLGDIVFSAANFWTINQVSAGGIFDGRDIFIGYCIRGASRTMLSMFVPGTFWKCVNLGSPTDNHYILRLDTIAPDPDCPLDLYGVRLGFKEISTVGDPFQSNNVSFRLWGPNPTWKTFVSGLDVDNYAIASAMWNSAKSARAIIGREQKMPDSACKLKQPLWGSDSLAITRWVNAVVSYGSTQKAVIQFEAPINDQTIPLKAMDYASFAWGPYKGNAVNGFICEIEPVPGNGVFSITLLCYGDFRALPSLLEESGVPLALESGPLIELENESLTSEKISELTLTAAATAAAAGAVIVTAIEDVGNNKVSLAEAATWITGIAEDYTDEVMQGHLDETNPHPQYSLKESDILSKERTGFVDGNNIAFVYDETARTVTLTGDLSYLWRSERRELVSPWTSPAHSSVLDAEYFLQSTNGIDFVWGTVPFDYANPMIAYVHYWTNDKFAIQETHGCAMTYASHNHGHDTAGTYRKSGGGLSAGSFLIAPASPTDAGNRPGVDATELWDEDKKTVVQALAGGGPYTQLYGNASNVSVFTKDALNIVPIGTTYPRYNLNGVLTELSTNKMMNVYRISVPVCPGTQSAKYGVLWVPGTGSYNSLAEAQGESLALNLGAISSLAPEYTECQRITIETSAAYTTVGKFRIAAVTEIGGTKQSQYAVGGTGVTSHWALSDVQGGAASDQWHLTQVQHTGLTGGSATSLHTHNLAQIENMSAFMRTVNNDATAADARATLGAASVTDVANKLDKVTGGAQTVAGPVTFNSGSIPIVTSRPTASVAGLVRCITIGAQSLGDMLDTFGSFLRFLIKDTAGVDNEIALLGASRDGADNSGKIEIQVANSGVMATRFSVDKTGLSSASDSVALLGQTASRVPYLDANKKLVSSSVTATELEYLSGVTSPIQTQFNNLRKTISFSSNDAIPGWCDGSISYNIPKTVQYANYQTVFSVMSYGGLDAVAHYTCRVSISIKVQNYVVTYKCVVLDGENYNEMVYSRIDGDVNFTYITPNFYVIPYGTTMVTVESGNVPSAFTGAYSATKAAYATKAFVYDNYLEVNDGTYAGIKVKTDGTCDKANYRGIALKTAYSVLNFMANTTLNIAGLFSETFTKWAVQIDPDGKLRTDFTPAAASDTNEISTTEWVRDRLADTTVGNADKIDGKHIVVCSYADKGTATDHIYFTFQ